jgi:hypothetical protein
MDLVAWDEDVYDEIVKEYKAFISRLEITDVSFIPISALLGDNIVDRSTNMPWYKGTTYYTCWRRCILPAIITILIAAFRCSLLSGHKQGHTTITGGMQAVCRAVS